MYETLLHFIWKNRYFDQHDLQTINGDQLRIINTGIFNLDQGPDFLMGRVLIDNQEWVGNIEIHVKTSDWNIHGHGNDNNYDNVILHVVWYNDISSFDLPVLELGSYVPSILLEKYTIWMMNAKDIPCSNDLKKRINYFNDDAIDLLLDERIAQKSRDIMQNVIKHQHDWEEVFWHELARAFGYRVNADTFQLVAKSIPWKILMKHRNSIHQLEALLMGQANLLRDDFNDQYSVMLFKEYSFLKKKYDLKKVWSSVFYLRMRPRNFPTIRLAQLSAVLAANGPIFPKIIGAEQLNDFKHFFDVSANDYWKDHYVFDIISPSSSKPLGGQIVNNIIVNVFMPFIYAYFKKKGDDQGIEKRLRWLKELLPEKNYKINQFINIGIKPKNAWESQALLQLKNDYCDKRKCLQCFLGKQLLGRPYRTIAAN